MQDGKRWITWKGRRILVNANGNIEKKQIGVHYGDLGKARDTYFFAFESSNRSTGHFGTGTYFFSKDKTEKDKNTYEIETYSKRPRHEVDFSEYELFKPNNKEDAEILHRGLKAINNMSDFNKYRYDFELLQLRLKSSYNIDTKDSSKAFYKTRDIYYSPKYQNARYDANLDSLSTIFMKELGFNGIDVRNIKEFDNSSYGSVIYDLNKKRGKK